MDLPDYYDTLGVAEDADTADIKKSYRKLARLYHPDVASEPDGEERFKRINEAWQVLKSDSARAEYDERRRLGDAAAAHGRAGGGSSGGGAGFEGAGDPFGGFGADPGAYADGADYSDFFRDVFGDRFRDAGARPGGRGRRRPSGPQRGEDVRATLSLPIREAFAGTRVPVSLRAPRVTDGGQVEMADRTLEVTIPAGIVTGRVLRLRGQGGAGFDGGDPGDLYIEISVTDGDGFTLEGRDVSGVLDVAPWELALGATVHVATLGGRVALKVPAGSQNGRRMRLRGRGFPGEPPGDHFAVLRLIMPPVTSEEQGAAWEAVKQAWPDGLAAREGG